MCIDPATLSMASMAMTAGSTVLSVAGAAQSAKAQAQSAMYMAAVARNNSVIADQNAQYATAKGEQQAEMRKMQEGMQRGAARAVMGASGVKIDSGSPLNVQGDIAAMGEIDVETIRNNAMREAYGYKTQGYGFDRSAELDTQKAGYDIQAGQRNIMTSLISGASSVADKWSKFKTVGNYPFDS